MKNMFDGDTFCELATTIIIFTKILKSSLKTSSCKPQALLMFNIMKYVFTQFHKILFDGILFFYTCSQEIVTIPAFPLQTATSKICSADRETASPLHSAVGYHANLMACREKTWKSKTWIEFSFLTDIHWITLLKTGWRTSWHGK